ncbi:MAG: class I SAM-dependent methyltransferase [Candidatus Acidiferrales bacterium]
MTSQNAAKMISEASEVGEKAWFQTLPRPSFRLMDLFRSPIHDFPIRDFIFHQYAPAIRGLRILEVGPGSGFTAYGLAPLVDRMTIVDCADVATNELKQKLRGRGTVRCVTADLSEPNLFLRLQERYDLIFGLDVFEYVRDPVCCLRNFNELLNPEGVAFLTFPNQRPGIGDGVTYFSRLEHLEILLERAGFSRWEILSVSLSTYAQTIYTVMHEWPLNIYRASRRGSQSNRAQSYEMTWAFKNRRRLARAGAVLHIYSFLLSTTLRLGGDPYCCCPAPREPLGHQLVVRAWR